MTKKEAELFLYNFLRKNGIVNRYYYNCIHFNDAGHTSDRMRFLKLKPRERLKAIMFSHMDTFKDGDLFGFFDKRVNSFAWDLSPEGYEYWDKWYRKWRDEILKLEDRSIET
jgi:hypothetical protein